MVTRDRSAVGTGSGADASESGRTIAKDDAFHLLGNARRRALVRYVLSRDDRDRFRVDDLVDEIAAWEHGTPADRLSPDERERVRVALHHAHLPALDDHGVVDYDRSRGVVVPTGLVSAFEPHVERGLHAGADHLVADPEPSPGE